MTLPTVTPREVRDDLIARREIALIDLREEDPFAKAHPLFASQLPLSRLELERWTASRARTPRSCSTTTAKAWFRRLASASRPSATPMSTP